MQAAHITSYCIGGKDNCQVKISKKAMKIPGIFDTIVQVCPFPLEFHLVFFGHPCYNRQKSKGIAAL